MHPGFTRKRHPQLASQRLRYPHGNKPLGLLCAEHVDAASKLGEVLVPQLLLVLLRPLTQTHGGGEDSLRGCVTLMGSNRTPPCRRRPPAGGGGGRPS